MCPGRKKQLEGRTIPRDNFEVLFADSEESYREDGRKENIFDASLTSFWHTEWSTDIDPPHPHDVWIDLSAQYSVDGFDYLPRQDGLDQRPNN